MMSPKHIDLQTVKKILIIKPRGIGDIVLSTILLDNLKAALPHARIDYLTEAFAADAVRDLPQVEKVHTFTRKDFFLSVVRRIRPEGYDLVIDAWSNPRTAQITRFSGARYRAGFAYRGRKYAYNFAADAGRGESHSAEHNLQLLDALGITHSTKRIHFGLTNEARKKAAMFLREQQLEGKFIIGVVPAGGWESKRVEPEKWVSICTSLSAKYDVRFLIIWGPGDEADADAIKKQLPALSIAIPNTSVKEMAGFIERCSVVLANDSGPMHIAAALGVPVAGIFGPTDPAKHGPYSAVSAAVQHTALECLTCNELICPKIRHECMLDLPEQHVLSALEQITEGLLHKFLKEST